MRSIPRGAPGASRSAGRFRSRRSITRTCRRSLRRRIGATQRARAWALRALAVRDASTWCSRRAGYMCEFLNGLGVHHTMHQPLGVDAEIFHSRAPHAGSAREARPAGRHAPAGLRGPFLGREESDRAAARVRATRQAVSPAADRRRIGNARPTPNITMLPYRRDSRELAQWLASADALVHAGTKETFGLVLLEAMACGRPVVAARAGAIPEIVDESVGMLAKAVGRREHGGSHRRALRAGHRSGRRGGARPRAAADSRGHRRFTAQVNDVHEPRSARRVHVAPQPAIELGSPTS